MTARSRALLPAAVLLLLTAAGCANSDAKIGVLPSIAPPPPGVPVSLSKDVQPIFAAAKCAQSGCHAPLAPQVNLILDNAADSDLFLVNIASMEAPSLKRVVPFDSGRSYLMNKLLGTDSSVGGPGTRMPLGLPALPNSDIQIIRDWIDQGALDN